MQSIAIIGAGAMGAGIAQVAAQNGHSVYLHDQYPDALEKAEKHHRKILARLVEKGRLPEGEDQKILQRIAYVGELTELSEARLFIEAVVENLEVKTAIFKQLDDLASPEAILASNTSSLSIASIAGATQRPERVVGIHFFNPAPLMPLVEIIPSIATSEATLAQARQQVDDWGKVTVVAQDTPGFIVNRVARPFYGEAVRLYEEGVASPATIDWAMTELGGFRMGPFTLMDFIGHDVNYTVSETVFKAFYYDPRYRPNFTQKRLVEAGWLGRKSGKGFYQYGEKAQNPAPQKDQALGREILERIVIMLINEAADARFLHIASTEDIDRAMTKGVNYPKGLLAWADEWGAEECVRRMDALQAEYGEDRYRCSPLLRRMARQGATFY
jgi:3-hydroxybutyryl-CoA dehydrogenase